MSLGLNQVFTTTSSRSGSVLEYTAEDRLDFNRVETAPSAFDTLLNAVADLRQYWQERNLDAGVLAARDGVDEVITHILKGKRFTTARDAAGLDAGYYIARYCLPYDFVATGVVARCGVVEQVARLRYYNQHPDGLAAFLSAIEAGVSFTDCLDDEGHNAGFYIARCGDEEVIARYEAAGGTFRRPELDYLGRTRTEYRKVG